MGFIQVLFSLLLVVNSASAQTLGWQHRRMVSTEGNEINVDFKYVDKCHRFSENGRGDNVIRMAGPVWFNVKGLRSSDRVQMEIEHWSQSNIRFGSEIRKNRELRYFDRELTLRYGGEDRHTAIADTLTIRHAIGSARMDLDVFQRLRFRVNGRVMRNSFDGSDWFEIHLDNKVGCGF